MIFLYIRFFFVAMTAGLDQLTFVCFLTPFIVVTVVITCFIHKLDSDLMTKSDLLFKVLIISLGCLAITRRATFCYAHLIENSARNKAKSDTLSVIQKHLDSAFIVISTKEASDPNTQH